MFKLFLLFAGLAVTGGNCHYFYRRDYTFIEELDAFYKFHWDPEIRTWTDAFKACSDEGAKLFYPKDDSEWAAVTNLTDSLSTQCNATDVLLGLPDRNGFGKFKSVDGQPIPVPINNQVGSEPLCVYMGINTGLYNVRSCISSECTPFVCKKIDENPCRTIDRDYVYYKEVNKCYKVNHRTRTWQEAYQTCYLEGAMLAVVENESEANQINKIIRTDKIYHAGYSKIDNVYYTVTGKRFDDNVYQKWWQNEDTDLQCGAVWEYEGMLYSKTVECSEIGPFICEMDIKSAL